MFTINDYTAAPIEVCVDCAADDRAHLNPGEFVGLDSDPETGEIKDPHFGKSPCDLCRDHLPGDRFHATLLIKTTTVRAG